MAIKLADDTEADVRGLQTTGAAAVGASKPKQYVATTDTLRILAMNSAGDAVLVGVSDDSLQCLLAGSQTLTGQKTFELPVALAEPGGSAIGSVGASSDNIELKHTDSGDVLILQTSIGDIKLDTVCGEVEVDSATQIVLKTGGGNTVLTLETSGDAIFENNIGIGTVSPSSSIHAYHTAPELILEDSDGGRVEIGGNNGDIKIGADEGNTQANSHIRFRIDSTEIARITSDGYMGVGTITPDGLLHVHAGSAGTVASAGQLTVENSGNALFQILTRATDEGRINFGDPDSVSAASISHDHNTDTLTINVSNNGSDIIVENTGTGTVKLDAACGAVLLEATGGDVGISSTLNVTIAADNVGINEASPAADLHITSNSPNLRMEDSDGGWNNIYNADGQMVLEADRGNTQADSYIGFSVDNDEKGRIDYNGYLGVGIDSPAALLDIRSASPVFRIQDTDGGYTTITADDGTLIINVDPGNTQSGSYFAVRVDNTEYFRVLSDGGLTATTLKSGATRVAAGAATNEFWVTSGHATQEDGTVMYG